jgi:type IV secretion system protein VirB10
VTLLAVGSALAGQRQYTRDWIVPEGTVLSLRMDSNLSSKISRAGDKFTATVTIPVYVDGKAVIPAGARVEGHVTQVTPARRPSKSGAIGVGFDDLIFPNGSRVRLNGSLTAADPNDRQRVDDESRVSGDPGHRSAVFVGSGAVVGAIIGGAAGGGKGAAIGGAVGAGAGIAGVLLSKGVEAEVLAGAQFGLQLHQPVAITETYIAERPREVNRTPAVTRRPAGPASRPTPTAPDVVSPTLPLSSPEMIRRAQVALHDKGYYEGKIDGIMGPRTANALKVYQSEHNLAETGKLDPDTARSLGIFDSGGRPQSAPAGYERPGVSGSEPPVRDSSVDPPRDPDPEPPSRVSSQPQVTVDPAALKRQAEMLLADYRRSLGTRPRYTDSEISLLFALASYANTASLYASLAPSLNDPAGARSAAVALATEARRADRVITTIDPQPSQSLFNAWDRIRQDVLRLMSAYNIGQSEIE